MILIDAFKKKQIYMTSTNFKNNKIQLCLAPLSVALFFFMINACTVNRAYVQPGTIPKLAVPNPGAEEFGKALFQEICIDYDLDSDN